MSEVLEFHDRIAAGLRGIETPWESLNRMTYGFSASDFVVFVARLGLGKTWMLLILAMHAWSMGKRVLIASTEMDQLRMSLRTLALHLKLPPDMLRRGRLGEARTAVQEAIQKMEDSPGLYMVGGGNYRLGFDSVEAAVEEVEPDIVLMDGAYLLTSPAGKDKPKNAGRFDKAADTFEECKQFNLRIGLPVVTTTQFNRSARRNSLAGAEVENIALSDTIGWAADYIFAQLQTDEMKDAKEMIIKPLKVREGSGWEFMLRWDIDGSDFREIPHTRREGAKAAAGTGGAGAAPIGDSLGGSNPFAKPPPSSASSTDHKF
jgi:replicative DNA helicase